MTTTPYQRLSLVNSTGFFGDAESHTKLDLETIKNDPIFNWEAVKAQSYYKVGDNFFEDTDKFKLVRSDNPTQVLGNQVAQHYEILQNADMVDWVSDYVTRGDMSLAGYGYFRHGATVFLQAFNDFEAEVNPNDKVVNFFLFTNYHGGGSVQISFCTQRVLCQNTLNIARKQGNKINLRHSQGLHERLETIKHRINLARQDFDDEMILYKNLANTGMTKKEFHKSLEQLFSKELKERAKRHEAKGKVSYSEDYPVINQALTNWDMLPDLQNVENTRWKGFNALNHCLNHGWGQKDPQDALRRMWEGNYADRNDSYKKQLLTV